MLATRPRALVSTPLGNRRRASRSAARTARTRSYSKLRGRSCRAAATSCYRRLFVRRRPARPAGGGCLRRAAPTAEPAPVSVVGSGSRSTLCHLDPIGGLVRDRSRCRRRCRAGERVNAPLEALDSRSQRVDLGRGLRGGLLHLRDALPERALLRVQRRDVTGGRGARNRPWSVSTRRWSSRTRAACTATRLWSTDSAVRSAHSPARRRQWPTHRWFGRPGAGQLERPPDSVSADAGPAAPPRREERPGGVRRADPGRVRGRRAGARPDVASPA